MKMTFNFMLGAALFVGLTGCSSSSDASAAATPAEVDEAQARATATKAIPAGTASAVTKLDDGDEHRWVVAMKMPNGAIVNAEIERASGVLAEIAGEAGPFDYEIPAPAAGFLTYGQAKEKALAAKVGAVEVWEVKPPETQYEFYVRETATSRLFEIKMDAKTGAVTTLEEKDKPD